MLRSGAERRDELVSFRALASRGRQEDVERLDAGAACDRTELAGGLRRRGDARLGDAAGTLDLLTERKPDTPLLERHDLPVFEPRDEEPAGEIGRASCRERGERSWV